MIVGKDFRGDDNEILKWDVQHDLYKQLRGYLFTVPKERFLKSAQLLGIEQELIERIRNIDRFDHRVIQYAHDIIASYFRYAHRRLIEDKNIHTTSIDSPHGYVRTGSIYEYEYGGYPYPNLKDCIQGDLFENNEDYTTCLKKNWVHFFHREVLYLTYEGDSFTKAAIMACLKQNQPDGYEAEDVLAGILFHRYNCWEWYGDHDMEMKKHFEEYFDDISKKHPYKWNIEITYPNSKTKSPTTKTKKVGEK